MPHLRFRGLDSPAIREPLHPVLEQLAAIIGCPQDWLTAEEIATRYHTPSAPMIEVLWFARGREVQDKVATVLATAYTKDGVAPVVVFLPVDKENYYEDGRSFA